VAEFMDADALVVIAVDGQVKQVLLTETRGSSAGSPHTLVQIGWVRGVSVLRHVGIVLVLADDDQIHALFDHGCKDIDILLVELPSCVPISIAHQGEEGGRRPGHRRGAGSVEAWALTVKRVSASGSRIRFTKDANRFLLPTSSPCNREARPVQGFATGIGSTSNLSASPFAAMSAVNARKY
jgi:hypothetical protein